jgi:hypothetical protein
MREINYKEKLKNCRITPQLRKIRNVLLIMSCGLILLLSGCKTTRNNYKYNSINDGKSYAWWGDSSNIIEFLESDKSPKDVNWMLLEKGLYNSIRDSQ